MLKSENSLSLLKTAAAKKMLVKFLILFSLGLLFFLIPKSFLGDTYPICLFRNIFNINCIGCGTTRAVWSVLHLKFADAFEYNKLIIVTFPLIVGCSIAWILKDNKNTGKK